LPSKVLSSIAGVSMLERVVQRVAMASSLDGIVVATTKEPDDDSIVDLLASSDVTIVRGSHHDVLDRYHDALVATQADIIVRITSDCPLIDPQLIDDVVRALDRKADYASNTLEPRTYPRGLDVEAVTAEALERTWAEDDDPATREHVTPYIYRHPDRFTLRRVSGDQDLSRHRWTVDTPEDLALVRRIYDALGDASFSWRDVLNLVEANPTWSELNKHVRQKPIS
jgi:spore coat polysaccharide biosynthesis protein SpsF